MEYLLYLVIAFFLPPFTLLSYAVLAMAIFNVAKFISDLPAPDADSKSGIGESVALLGLTITVPTGLVYSQTNKPAMSLFSTTLFLFLAISGSIIVANFLLVTSRRIGANDDWKRTYEPGTITFAKWVLLCSICLTILTPVLAWQGALPNQIQPVTLRPPDFQVEKYTFTKGIPDAVGIQLTWKVYPHMLKENGATTIEIDYQWRDTPDAKKVFQSFRVAAGRIYRGDVSTKTLYPEPPFFDHTPADLVAPRKKKFKVALRKLPILMPNEYYTIALLLAPTKDEQLTVDEALEELPTAINVRMEPR